MRMNNEIITASFFLHCHRGIIFKNLQKMEEGAEKFEIEDSDRENICHTSGAHDIDHKEDYLDMNYGSKRKLSHKM